MAMTRVSEGLLLGAAPTNFAGSLGGLGVGPMGNTYVYDIVPLTLQVDGLALSQTILANASFVLTAGPGVTKKTRFDGQVIYELDVARGVTITTATSDFHLVLITVFGYDVYGQQMSAGLGGPNNNTVTTKKAFKSIYRITSSGNMTATPTTIGFGDQFGLPYRVTDAGYISSVRWDNTLAQDTGTFVAADQTNPSISNLGDVRGTYTTSSASDGNKRLVIGIYLPDEASGPNATRTGALGVKQNLQAS